MFCIIMNMFCIKMNINFLNFLLNKSKKKNSKVSCLQTVDIKGSGIVNKLIDKLPIELHIPGYSFCGPGTKLVKRLDQGDKEKNKLDSICKVHDIAYQSKDSKTRRYEDKLLTTQAWTSFTIT